MQSRKGCWRTPLLALTAVVLALAPVSAMADNRDVLRQQQPKSQEDTNGARQAFTPPEAVPLNKPILYPRTERFWGLSAGPTYGFLSLSASKSPDVVMLRVGSFVTSGPGLALPSELRASDVPKGRSYYIVQFTQDAFAPDRIEGSIQQLKQTGAELIDYVPNNAYIVRVDAAKYQAVAGSHLLQYVAPYHPGYKIAPDLGTSPLPDAAKAASPVYSLVVRGFPGSSASQIAGMITSLGGTVSFSDDSEAGPTVLAELTNSKVLDLAKNDEVRAIDENLPVFANGEESSWNVIAGTYVIGSKPKLYLSGVDGSGKYLKDVDNAPTSVAIVRVAGPEDVDWNGNGVIDNAAQIIADTDTGMSVDGGDFAETATTSGWNGNNGTGNVPRFGDGLTNRNHRKIAWYEVAPGGFGNGNLLSCDNSASHGTVTSGQAAGNASSGPFTADGLDWSGDGTVDNYGDPNTSDTCGPGFCFTSGPTTFRVDGVAPGARLIFQDVNGGAQFDGCPEADSFLFGSYNTLLTDARGKGARIHTFSFGGGGTEGIPTAYDSSAQAIDAFLSTDANRDYLMFIAAGNNGSTTTDVSPSGRSQSLSNEASAKNAISLGANFSGNSAALQTRVGFSSIGPAPNGVACSPQLDAGHPAASNCGRIKPDLMAPGADGNTGLAESYNCVTSDHDQVGTVECLNVGGNSGTSFSTPNAAGAGALVRDYFVQGLYPDGTSANVSNTADRASKISGAMVKTLLIASAGDMNGGGLTNPTGLNIGGYNHRYNPEYGYGFVNLRNVLPLTTDPLTPPGLIVHDAGCPTGATCPSNLSLPLSMAVGATASVEFSVLDEGHELRVALAWADPVDGGLTGALVDNLDLELRYCGPDQNCGTVDGKCIRGSNNGVACASNATCLSGGVQGICARDQVFYGNVFTEDTNDDGIEDQNLDGTPGMNAPGTVGHWHSEGAFSIPNLGDPGAFTGEAAKDASNNTEALFLSPDPEGDGTGSTINPSTNGQFNLDNQLRTGKWLLTIKHPTGPNAVKYAVAIAGPVTIDSSVRLDTNPITCNGEVAVVVNEVAKSSTIDAGCNSTNGCTNATTISARTSIVVKTTGNTQVDKENAPVLTKDPNALNFSSQKLPVSTIANVNSDDDILVAGDGYTVTATYNDQDCTLDGTAGCRPLINGQPDPAETIARTSQATYDCTPNVDFFAIGQPGRNAVFLLAGGCDDDKFLDSRETFTYLVQFANLEDTLSLEDVSVTLRAVTPDADNTADPGRLNNTASPYVTVDSGTVLIGSIAPGFLESAGFSISVNTPPAWPAVPARPPEVELVVGISSTKAGKSSASYGSFKHILNGTLEKFLYSTDYPTGAIVDRDINSDEKISNPIRDTRQRFPQDNARDNYDKLNESITFSDLTTVAFGGGNPAFNGPWDFDSNDEGFRTGLYAGSKGNIAEITNFGEDKNYNNVLDGATICINNASINCSCSGGIYPCGSGTPRTGQSSCASDVRCLSIEDFDGDQDGTLDEGYNTLAGCGFQTSANIATGGGAWHTGQIGPRGAATCSSPTFPANPGSSPPACELIDVVPGTARTNLWLEYLRSPVINKVHRNADNRTVDYRVELTDWRWNLNADFEPDIAAFSWEFDENTQSLEPVDLEDGVFLRIHNDGLGPLTGSNVNLTRGFPMWAPNDPDDDVTPFGQANGTSTRSRTGDRSCMFQNLVTTDATLPAKLLRVSRPADDDCDNDIVSFGPDGGPGIVGVDDDGDGVVDNPEEACPCFGPQDAIDDDGDGLRDEGDERQRFYRCSVTTTQRCVVTGVNADNCGLGNGTCGHNGDGKPIPYGDDVCGDGAIDEGVSAKWATETVLGENGHRIAQTQNWDIGTLNGPALRVTTLEDTYDAEAGNSFQAALGFVVFESSAAAPPKTTYGVGVDDMTVEWSEEHPIEQTATEGCGNKSCTGGPRAGKLCFNTDDCGAGGTCGGAASTSSSCAALTWGVTFLYSGSGTVKLNLVDFNAETTQGTFSCVKYGFPGTSNDCDGDGLKEVEVFVRTSAEPGPEFFRLEQTSSGSSSYSGQVPVSSQVNAANDGVVFMQFNGALNPSLNAFYFDRDSGAGDANGDGTLDGPPNVGKDGCPGFCNVDDDLDAPGTDKRGGFSNINDDGNGVCNFQASNGGSICVRDADCPGGGCLNVDEVDEMCSKVCTAGTTAGMCSANSGNPSAVCTTPGVAGICTGGGICVANQCTLAAQCGSGGACGATLTACGAGSTVVNGRCQRGEDNCNNVDEADELCPIANGKLAAGIDDNCGCANNPVTATVNAAYDVADLVVANYTVIDNNPGDDNDGFADTNELVNLAVTLRNLSDFDVENVVARLTSQSSNISCINDSTAKFGRINVLQSVSNGVGGTNDALQFTVANVNRAAISDILQAPFVITVSGTAIMADGSKVPVEGTAVPQSLTLDLDIDVNGAAPPAATVTKAFSFEPSQYGNDAAFQADWAHTFVPTAPGLHCQYNNPSNPAARSAPVGCFLRQDPGTDVPDDWHLHTAAIEPGGRDSGSPGTCSGGGTPGGVCGGDTDCPGKCAGGKVPGEFCTGTGTGNCRGACSGNTNIRCDINNDCAGLGLGKCTAPLPGSCTNPSPGSCLGLGAQSLHMGFHRTGAVEGDTVHLDQMTYAYYKPTIQVGLGRAGTDTRPTLDFWHQLSLGDERLFTGLNPPYTLEAGVLHVLVDRNSNTVQDVGPPADPTKDGWWEKLTPFYGAPGQQRLPVGNCAYDPSDDSNNENDLSDASPTFIFSASGTIFGPSSTCFPEFVYGCAGDSQDPPWNGSFQIEAGPGCYPESAPDGSPIYREGPGPGRWIETKVDLYPYRGRQIWIRWFTTNLQFGAATWTDVFGGQDFGGNRDDGWYIDDIKISGLNSASFTLKADTDAPPTSSCPNPNTCLPINAHLSGSTFPTRTDGIDNDGDTVVDESDEGAFTTVLSDAPLRNVLLNGQDLANATTTAGCLNGVLQYRFSIDGDFDGTTSPSEIFRDWTEDPHATANPAESSTVVMDVRCSSLQSCVGRTTLNIVISDTPYLTFIDKNNIKWSATTGASTYDIATYQGTGGTVGIPADTTGSSAATWLAPNSGYFDNMATGPQGVAFCSQAGTTRNISAQGSPSVGHFDIWLVRKHGGSWEEVGSVDFGGVTRDTVMSDASGLPPICP